MYHKMIYKLYMLFLLKFTGISEYIGIKACGVNGFICGSIWIGIE